MTATLSPEPTVMVSVLSEGEVIKDAMKSVNPTAKRASTASMPRNHLVDFVMTFGRTL
jgi:hypothetical protein